MIKASQNLYRRLQRDINNGVKVNKEQYYECQRQLIQARKILNNEIWKGVKQCM